MSRSTFLKGAAGVLLGAGGLLGGMGSAVAAGTSAVPRATGPIKDLTGEETARFGFRGTDLGFTAKTRHGYCVSIFGDTFDTAMPGGPGWRSPVGLRQSNSDIQNGIR